MSGFRQGLWGRAAAPALCVLVFAGCLAPAVYQPEGTRQVRSTPGSPASRRGERTAVRRGHIVTSPRTGFPTLPEPPRPYSDWEAPWGWTYAPSLESHWDSEKALDRLEGRLDDLQRPNPPSDDKATRERR